MLSLSLSLSLSLLKNFKIFIFAGVRQPSLSRFYLECIQKARLYTDRSFHSIVSFQRLAIWGLGLEPSAEALAHELTVRRCEFYLPSLSLFSISLSLSLSFFFLKSLF